MTGIVMAGRRYRARGPAGAIPLHGWLIDVDAGHVYGRTGRPLGTNFNGYVRINGQSRGFNRVFAHRLVWEAAHGPIPAGMEPNHKNGIKSDNRIANLELVTRRGNLLHAFANGLKSNAGERHPRHRLTDATVLEIRRRHAIGESNRQLAKAFGINRQTISDAVLRRTWAHVPEASP